MNKLNGKNRNINMKSIFTIFGEFLVTGFILTLFQSNALAANEKYDWASGYKIRTVESWDGGGSFKGQGIEGGKLEQYQSLMSTWSVTQGNWDSTYPQCRNQTSGTRPPCEAAGTFYYDVVYEYTCSGDVKYDLQTSIDANNLVGGDTMYGAWSMLFSYFPPVLDSKSCSEFGRCFVGNAFIMDTKAQKEEPGQSETPPGRMWGLGVKELIEGPGDVFYFDQVRAMTQPPRDTGSSFNNPYLIGPTIAGLPPAPPGGGSGECDGAIFDNELANSFSPDPTGEAVHTFEAEIVPLLGNADLFAAYAAAEEETGIPCEILAGVHYQEGGMDPNRSLWDGGPLHGTLAEDVLGVAKELAEYFSHSGCFGCQHDFYGYIQVVTLHNGRGNDNCRADGFGSPTSYDCYPPVGGYVPTSYRANGYCPPTYQDEDSEYALNWIDSKHRDMDIIFCQDYVAANPCPTLCPNKPYPENPRDPERRTGPGALTVAYMLHDRL